MSLLTTMMQQCTIPSFWGQLPAANPCNRKLGPREKQAIRGSDVVLDILKSSKRALMLSDVLEIANSRGADVTKNIVEGSLRRAFDAGKVTKEVRSSSKSGKVCYWRAV